MKLSNCCQVIFNKKETANQAKTKEMQIPINKKCLINLNKYLQKVCF